MSVIDVTEDDIKQRNTYTDDTLWATSPAVCDIREMHSFNNANGEVILS